MLLHKCFSHLNVEYQELPETDPCYVIQFSGGRPHHDRITLILTLHEMANLLQAIDQANDRTRYPKLHIN